MFRIDNASAVPVRPTPGPPGTPGWFTNGNPALAQEATIVDDWWANSVQEEILTVIEQAGLVPDKSNIGQLYEALNKLYMGVGNLDETYLTIAGWRQWTAPILTQNTPTAYTITYTRAPGALQDGMLHLAEFHVANEALPTLNVNFMGPKPIHYYSVGAWRPLPPGLVGPNQVHPIAYHAGTDAYRLIHWRDVTGDYVPTGRATARLGTILGLGQAVSRTEYGGLFAAFGTTYGQGNGSTTFNLPDLRGRTIAGTDMGAGRLGTQIGGTLGSIGGQEWMQFAISGTTGSQAVAGSAYTSGTAYTNGIGVHVWGGTGGPDSNTQGQGGGGFTAATQYHGHSVDIWGNVVGNAGVDSNGWITGWTGGAGIGGATDVRTNMPPTIVANYAICL